MTNFDPWRPLQKFTAARIALGRAGASLPTRELLDFNLAHAQARDAVHSTLNIPQLKSDLAPLNLQLLELHTQPKDRYEYLHRPDLGRQLTPASITHLEQIRPPDSPDLALILADGLSATAAQSQIPPLLAHLLPQLKSANITLAPTPIVTNARVALQDQIGQLLHARAAVILLGERPGLGSPDSLGAYLVFNPNPQNTDANRNCISNIRPSGLPPQQAAHTIFYLLKESLHQKLSGIPLKDLRDDSKTPSLTEGTEPHRKPK